jgi:hypothetical protein
MTHAAAAHRLPITMRTVFQDLLLITYAVRPDALAALLPSKIHPHVRADARGGDTSFVSIVIGNMCGMRPHLLPEPLGTNYYQIVYRAVAELRPTGDGRRARPGVFFLRSDANDPVMSFFGNRLSEFRFHYFRTGAISLFARDEQLLTTVETADRAGDLVLHHRDLGPAEHHPPAEGFPDVAAEKQTLVQLFHAYAHDPARDLVYDLEIERGDWRLRRLQPSTDSARSSRSLPSRVSPPVPSPTSTSATAPTSGNP